ncbi:MAG TPA: DUF362 domain-containing protein [Desulfobacteraceae bacterium]|nr:DUF362 domain-containing protein [Desulfobacteraceae bacterium]
MDLQSQSVALARCRSYDDRLLAETLDAMWSACGAPLRLRSAKILLKPNLISARSGPLACTDGKFILTAAEWFLDRGCAVTVGDSPAFGTAQWVLHKIGCLESLRKRGIGITNFKNVRMVSLPSGIRAGLAADALDCDLLVNLPKVKAHAQLRVSAAVKNFFGCLAGRRKPLWHMVHGGRAGAFEFHLVELLSALPNSMTIVDGIVGMHRTGPLCGRAFALGMTACSANPVAVDRALLDIIGVEPQASPLMTACARAGLPGSRFDDLDFPLRMPRDLRVQGFEVPQQLAPIRFSLFRFLRGSCRRILQRSDGTD